MTPWEIHALEVSNCNCAYGCPCQFNALPTTGTCEAAVGMTIQKGHYGDVSLDGLNVAMTVKWPGPIHEGNGEKQIIIDERASGEQRTALEAIISGQDTEDMATIFWVINAMTTTNHETLYKPITVEGDMEARKGRVLVDDGFEFTIAEMASVTATTHGVVELPNNKGTHSHIAELHLNNSGVMKAAA